MQTLPWYFFVLPLHHDSDELELNNAHKSISRMYGIRSLGAGICRSKRDNQYFIITFVKRFVIFWYTNQSKQKL